MILALLAAMAWPAMAEEDDGSGEGADTEYLEDEYAMVEFDNAQIQSADLYVTKNVQVMDGDDTDYSEVEFTFYLWLDGSVARQQVYTLWDGDGNQVYEDVDGVQSTDPTGAIIFKTTRQGMFTLRAGQTARFEEVGTGVTYKVEESLEDGWTQILPSGGAAAEGTVTSTGSVASFTNMNGNNVTTTGLSKLVVYKTASFPTGWTFALDPEFTFNIQVGGSILSLEAFDVYSQNTGFLLETDYTDAQGDFTLHAGEYAVFSVPSNKDYTVSEVTDLLPTHTDSEGNEVSDGWRVTSDDSYSGSTGTGTQTVVFNNAIASFIVTKSLAAGSEDDGSDFSFILTDGSGHLWSGAEYWLYDIYGKPIYDDDGELITLATDENGEFTLKANQAAVFFGIDGGTAYAVKEKAQSGWSQVVPASEDGYSKTVSDAVDVLHFENEYVDISGTLAVTKNVSAAEGDLPSSDMDFGFYLYSVDSAGSAKAVSGVVYSIRTGGKSYTYRTGSDGSFSIKNGQTAVFSTLVADATYGVAEAASSTVKYALQSVTVNGEKYSGDDENPLSAGDVFTGELTEDGLSYVFTNGYYSSRIDPDPEPEEPDEPDEPVNPEDDTPDTPDHPFEGFTLPEVGGPTFTLIILIGVACVVVGVILFRKKKPGEE